MLDNVKNIPSQPEIQMLFSENPDVYVKKTSSNSDLAPANYPKAHLFVLEFFHSETLLHSDNTGLHLKIFFLLIKQLNHILPNLGALSSKITLVFA